MRGGLLVLPRALVFDLDGLLVATEDACFQTARTMLGRYSGRSLSRGEFAGFVGVPVDTTWRTLRDRYELRPSVAELVDERNSRLLRWYATPTLMPGAAEIVGWAREQGVQLAIASGAPSELVDVAARSMPIGRCFQTVVAADHELVSATKPAPDVYVAACRILGVSPSEAIAIEDSPSGATAALAAGITTVVVRNDWTRHAQFPDGVIERESLSALRAELSAGVSAERDPRRPRQASP